METNLIDKTVVITGATSGIGQAAAEQLARAGAWVIGVGRSPERCRAAALRLAGLNPAGRAACLTADLSVQSQVRALALEVEETLRGWGRPALDGLINNAGTFTYWLALTPEGFETQWAVNVLAPYLLTRQLLPLLHAAPAARVITVSSASHYGASLCREDIQLLRRYNGLRAYGQSKLAEVLLTVELNRRLAGQSSLRAAAADPGLVQTEIGFKGTPAPVQWIWRLRRGAGIPAEQSAAGIVQLLAGPGLAESTEVYWKHGRAQKPDRRALDPFSAAWLWDTAARMTGLEPDFTLEAAGEPTI